VSEPTNELQDLRDMRDRVRALCVRYRTSDETVDEFIDRLRAAMEGPDE